MSSWNSTTLKFDPFGPLKPPLQSILTVLESVEAVLEAVLAIVKAFSLDFGNPLQAAIATILAAVRVIINQVKSSGFAVLLIHPDFSQPDFGAVLQSVNGSYPRFESKVVSKFSDTTDVYRPNYPNGSSVAMFVFCITTDSPGDLMTQIFSLLYFLKHPIILSGLPAPVNVKALPVNSSGAAISRFQKLFNSDLDKAIQLSWQMPMAPAGGTAPGFLNAMVSFYDSFRFPNFVIERSSMPQGATVQMMLQTPTTGKSIASLQSRFNFTQPDTTAVVQEAYSKIPLKHFETKTPITSAQLTEGTLTGTYEYLDKDFSDSDRGSTFYYRVRAYFGAPNNYLNATSAGDGSSGGDYSDNIATDPTGKLVYKFENGVVMGNPSPIARGYVPRSISSSSSTSNQALFNLYNDIYRAIRAGILLNFEFPPAIASDNAEQKSQKTGWGTMSIVGGQIAPLKNAYKSSDKLQASFLFNTTTRRIADQCSAVLYSNPNLADLVASKWAAGASEAVTTLENTKAVWQFIGIKSGITTQSQAKITAYLAQEANYKAGAPITGPFPIIALTPDEPDQMGMVPETRQQLADFLRTALTTVSGQAKYLSWYSVSIGDLFPAFVPFIFGFEQFLVAMLQSVQSALVEIENIIQTLISKIRQLEDILNAILAMINLLNISVSVSILGYASANGSAASLSQALQASENKPMSTPNGLHSGIVMTAGGPGAGSIAALQAVAFLVGIKLG